MYLFLFTGRLAYNWAGGGVISWRGRRGLTGSLRYTLSKLPDRKAHPGNLSSISLNQIEP